MEVQLIKIYTLWTEPIRQQQSSCAVGSEVRFCIYQWLLILWACIRMRWPYLTMGWLICILKLMTRWSWVCRKGDGGDGRGGDECMYEMELESAWFIPALPNAIYQLPSRISLLAYPWSLCMSCVHTIYCRLSFLCPPKTSIAFLASGIRNPNFASLSIRPGVLWANILQAEKAREVQQGQGCFEQAGRAQAVEQVGRLRLVNLDGDVSLPRSAG